MVILRMKHNLRIFLRRHYPHQVKGSKVNPSSQPVKTSSPVKNSIASGADDVNRSPTETIDRSAYPVL